MLQLPTIAAHKVENKEKGQYYYLFIVWLKAETRGENQKPCQGTNLTPIIHQNKD